MAEGYSSPKPFAGFGSDDIERAGELNSKLGLRRVGELESMIEKVLQRVEELEKESKVTKSLSEKLGFLEAENQKLRKENENLRKEMTEMKGKNRVLSENLSEVKKTQVVWKQVNEQNEQSMKRIIDEQQKEKQKEKKEIKEQVIQVIKEKEKFVRTTMDRVKCVVLFGVEEEKVDNRLVRGEKEKHKIKQVLSTVVDDMDDTVRQIEEYHRLGKYDEGKDRPIKIKFATQSCAEDVISKAWKLAQVEELKKVWISKDMDLEERETQRRLVLEAKEKNYQRTEEEKRKFYWRVRDLRLKKNYYRS